TRRGAGRPTGGLNRLAGSGATGATGHGSAAGRPIEKRGDGRPVPCLTWPVRCRRTRRLPNPQIMARPGYTTRLTSRLEPTLLHDLETEADANGDDLCTHVRNILTKHADRRSTERRESRQ